MSVSRHPIALRIERAVGGQTALLATVMFLPLLDGIFAALVLADALETTAGILQVGLLIFSGSATVAVVLAEFEGSPQECARVVLMVGIPLVILAGIEAALAPAIASVLDLVIFERFAALVILAIAASTASARVGDLLPRPAIIVGLGLVASIDPAGAELVLVTNSDLVVRGMMAAIVGVVSAAGVAMASPWLRDAVDLDRFRFGSAVALGLLPLSIMGLPFGEHAPLAVLGLTALFALDPGAEDRSVGAVDRPDPADEEPEPAPSHEPERAPWL